MFCTRNSPNIFPVGYAASIKQDLLPPASIVDQEEREAFNWDTFRSTFLPENVTAHSAIFSINKRINLASKFDGRKERTEIGSNAADRGWN